MPVRSVGWLILSLACAGRLGPVAPGCKPLMPATYHVPGTEPVIERACGPYEYVSVPATQCAFLKCEGPLVFAFCDAGRYMYCACDAGEPFPPPYHHAPVEPSAPP